MTTRECQGKYYGVGFPWFKSYRKERSTVFLIAATLQLGQVVMDISGRGRGNPVAVFDKPGEGIQRTPPGY